MNQNSKFKVAVGLLFLVGLGSFLLSPSVPKVSKAILKSPTIQKQTPPSTPLRVPSSAPVGGTVVVKRTEVSAARAEVLPQSASEKPKEISSLEAKPLKKAKSKSDSLRVSHSQSYARLEGSTQGGASAALISKLSPSVKATWTRKMSTKVNAKVSAQVQQIAFFQTNSNSVSNESQTVFNYSVGVDYSLSKDFYLSAEVGMADLLAFRFEGPSGVRIDISSTPKFEIGGSYRIFDLATLPINLNFSTAYFLSTNVAGLSTNYSLSHQIGLHTQKQFQSVSLGAHAFAGDMTTPAGQASYQYTELGAGVSLTWNFGN